VSAVIAFALENWKALLGAAVALVLVGLLAIARIELAGARAAVVTAKADLVSMTAQRDVAVRAAQQNADSLRQVTSDKADSDRRLAIAAADLAQASADRARTVTTIREEIAHAATPNDCAPAPALRAAHAGARRLLDQARAASGRP
jgi:hypothetical protein